MRKQSGFTLIEMSIVLVVIGLIVGGILVGQDLIRAAGVRAQIAQIEKYNTAVNTFREKTGYLPGDIPNPYAAQFGLASRGPNPSEGDGNGTVTGIWCTAATGCGCTYGCIGGGETGLFWVDLSQIGLIDGGFNTATATTVLSGISSPTLGLYTPTAKIGRGNYVSIDNGDVDSTTPKGSCYNGINYAVNHFAITAIGVLQDNGSEANVGLTVAEAAAIDSKMDDGLPQTGQVKAMYPNDGSAGGQFSWAMGGGSVTSSSGSTACGAIPGASASPTISTCYDNGGGTGVMQYSTRVNNGRGVNCALSFQFQ